MAIKREWNCAAHGPFESERPVCPRGCSGGHTITRAFYTAPALTGDRTKNIDRTLAALAKDYGLTDMNNDHGHGAAKIPQRPAVPDFAPQWGAVAPGGTYQVGRGPVNTDRGQGAIASVAAYGSRGGNSLADIAGIVPPRPQIHGIDRTPVDKSKAPD